MHMYTFVHWYNSKWLCHSVMIVGLNIGVDHLFSLHLHAWVVMLVDPPFICALIRIQPRRNHVQVQNCLHLASNLRDTPLASCSCMICGRVPHFQTAAEKRQDFTLTADSA